MTRTHARSPIGDRVADEVPRNRGQVLTVLGAMRADGETALGTIDAATSGDVFIAYMQQIVVPMLRPGDFVVMDNLGAHKARRVRDLIEAAGARIHWLPPYSPETNPIELFWAWMKARLRSVGARTREALDRGIAEAAAALLPAMAASWVRHCGYWGPRT